MPEIAQATTELPPHSHGVDTTAASFDTSTSSMSSCMKQARSLLNAVSSCSQSSTPTSSKTGEDQNTQPWEMEDQPMEKYATPHRNDRKRSRPLQRSDPSTWPNAPLVSSPLGEGSRKRRRTESAFTASSESLDVEEELEPSVALQGLDDSGTLRAGVLVACTQRAHEDSVRTHRLVTCSCYIVAT
jgi:hypothetical protein